jgi:hypothetical protein
MALEGAEVMTMTMMMMMMIMMIITTMSMTIILNPQHPILPLHLPLNELA